MSATSSRNENPPATPQTRTQSKAVVPTAPLPDPIGRNIEAIIALHTEAEKDVSRHQRTVETITAFFGRPAFLYGILLVVALWMSANSLPRRFNVPRFDPPPFDWLNRSITFGSLLMTTGVLIAQNRQDKLAEQRAQLNLQLNLLSEQKIAKLIALVDELRHDLPQVSDQDDPETKAMEQPVDPQVVMKTLDQTLDEELSQLQKRRTRT